VEAMFALNVVKMAGVLLLAAASLLVLHIVKLADTEAEAPPHPAAAVHAPADHELPRAA
jgi:hypothetical protein